MALFIGSGFALVLAAFEVGIRAGWFTRTATSFGSATAAAVRTSRPAPMVRVVRRSRISAGRA